MTSGRSGLACGRSAGSWGAGRPRAWRTGQLLERFAADRDEAAFEALVTRHGPMVLGTCRRMLADPHDVEDAFQATFLVLARKAGSIRDGDRLGPWLHGVARRVAPGPGPWPRRRNARERPGGEEPAVEPPDALEAVEVRAALDEELARLPEKYRAPLVLCYLEGLTHDEAAQPAPLARRDRPEPAGRRPRPAPGPPDPPGVRPLGRRPGDPAGRRDPRGLAVHHGPGRDVRRVGPGPRRDPGERSADRDDLEQVEDGGRRRPDGRPDRRRRREPWPSSAETVRPTPRIRPRRLRMRSRRSPPGPN